MNLKDAINQRFGAGTIMNATTDATDPVAAFHAGSDAIPGIAVAPTGIAALDSALGVGGWPCGRVVEVSGAETTGKTTVALAAVAAAQRAGHVCAWIDGEHDFDPAYAVACGVDLKALLISQPDSLEAALDIAETLARSGAVQLIVVDTLTALRSQGELDVESETHRARLVGAALRKLTAVCHRTGTTVMFLCELRRHEPLSFGTLRMDQGGTNALKFYASIRVQLQRLERDDSVLDSCVKPHRSRHRAKVSKNKCAPPFRSAEFAIRWGAGVEQPGVVEP